jgi:rhodanese-related sulfurtransferase
MSVARCSIQELEALLGSDELYACLDVRERGEFSLVQIEGVTPLPRGSLEYRLETMVPSKQVPVVFCCDDARRSELAAGTAQEMGYRDVRVLDGGLVAWSKEGRPTISGWGVRGKAYAEHMAVDRAVPQMTAEDLADRRARGDHITVVDVRTAEEFTRGHVPGARHVAGGQLLLQWESLGQGPEDTTVVSCAGRTRGILGAETLRLAGLPRVYALLNGAMGWRLAGYDIEMGADDRQISLDAGALADQVVEATQRLAEREGVRWMSLSDLDALVASGGPFYEIDVRLPAEYGAGHVPGSVSIPSGQFALTHENFLAIRSAPLVLLADDAIRPVWAAVMCQDLGFPNVFVLDGGLGAWTAAGRLLSEGPGRPSVFGLALAQAQAEGVNPSQVEQARAADRSLLVLDVRSSGEFAPGHIPGSRWLARGRLELGIAELAPDRETPIVTVCDNGARGALAAATLRNLGYPRAQYLDGGLDGWRAEGRRLVEGLDGATVSRAEAQGDFGHTQWTGPLARTREDMEQYLAWEEALAHR